MITLKTLDKATSQEVYDQVLNHARTQKAKALVPALVDPEAVAEGYPPVAPLCAYRTPEGLKCFGGCLIADDEYDPRMERASWISLSDTGIVPRTHRHLIQSLQSIHDTYEISEWEGGFRRIASEYKLTYTHPPVIAENAQ